MKSRTNSSDPHRTTTEDTSQPLHYDARGVTKGGAERDVVHGRRMWGRGVKTASAKILYDKQHKTGMLNKPTVAYCNKLLLRVVVVSLFRHLLLIFGPRSPPPIKKIMGVHFTVSAPGRWEPWVRHYTTQQILMRRCAILDWGSNGPRVIHVSFTPNDASIGLSAFVGLTVTTNRHTHRQTSVTTGRILCYAMRPNNTVMVFYRLSNHPSLTIYF